MRQGQSKRSRGRSRGGKSSNPLSRTYESNGPDVKIRGTAGTIADRYVQLARDAQSSGDPVAAESYFQHAEHYYRLLAAAQPAFQQGQGGYPGFTRADQDDLDGDEEDFEGGEDAPMPVGMAQPTAPYLQPPRDGDQEPRRDDREFRRDDRDQPREPRRFDRDRDYQREPRRERADERDYSNGNREPRREPYGEGGGEGAAGGNGLPAFITGGANGEPRERPAGEEGENGARFGNGRNRRRRYPRYREGEAGMNGAPSENRDDGSPAPAPDFAVPDAPTGE